jgi:hypothetical protein
MTDYLITYDLEEGSPDPHKPFLSAAANEGLLYVWKGANYVNRLPNTTVWGVFATKEAADAAFDRALSATARTVRREVSLEKRCTVEMSKTTVKSDRRKKPDPRWTGNTNFETSRLHQLNDPFFR